MSAVCKDICKLDKSPQMIIGYAFGQKICRICDHKWIQKEIQCKCCKQRMRTKPRYNREAPSKKRLWD